MKNIINSLETIIANSYALAVKTQNYHWNVTGVDFKSVHEMFGAQYEELADAIDVLAERVRALGVKIDASLQHFAKASIIKEGNKNFSSKEMLHDLASDHKMLVKMLKEGIALAQQESDDATMDMLIVRVEAHDKAIWMLESSI